MPKLERALRRERKRNKKISGMVVGSKSVFVIEAEIKKRRKQIEIQRERKRKQERSSDTDNGAI